MVTSCSKLSRALGYVMVLQLRSPLQAAKGLAKISLEIPLERLAGSQQTQDNF